MQNLAISISKLLTAAKRLSVLSCCSNRQRWVLVLLVACTGLVGCSSRLGRRKVNAIVNARQLSLRGLDAMERGRQQDAEQLFARAVSSNPADQEAHYHYAEALWQRGDTHGAITHMARAAQLSGGDPRVAVRLGEMHYAVNDISSARRMAETALDADIALAEAWSLQGDVLAAAGEIDQALASYHRALSYRSDLHGVQLAIARLYRQTGRNERALSVLHNLVAGFPAAETPRGARLLLGIAMKDLERYEDATETFQSALAVNGDDPELLFHLAEAHYLSGNPSAARRSLESALNFQPDHNPSRKLLRLIARNSVDSPAKLR